MICATEASTKVEGALEGTQQVEMGMLNDSELIKSRDSLSLNIEAACLFANIVRRSSQPLYLLVICEHVMRVPTINE